MTDPNDMDGSIFAGRRAAPPDDAWLERLLVSDAAAQPHVDDNGFSSRVFAALPLPRKSVSRWLVPAMTVAGCAATAFLTPAGDYFANGLVGLLDVRHFTPSNLLLLVPIALLYGCSYEAVRDA